MNEKNSTRTYDQILSAAMSLRKSDDAASWGIGDLALELEELVLGDADSEDSSPQEKKDLLAKFAADVGVTVEYISTRARISRRIPKTGALAWIRSSSLSITAVRAFYHIKDDETLLEVAKKALTQTVEQIRKDVQEIKDEQAVDEGSYFCALCDQPIENTEDIINLRYQRRGYLFGSPSCLLEFARQIAPETEVETVSAGVEVKPSRQKKEKEPEEDKYNLRDLEALLA